MLRKALSVCGNQDNIILTVPRRGFSLSGKISISMKAPQEAMAEDPSDIMNESEGENGTHDENLMADLDYTLYPESAGGIRSKHAQAPQARKRETYALIFILILIGILSLSVTSFIFMSGGVGYSKRFEFNGCNFFSNENSNDNSTMNVALKTSMKCKKRSYVYVTYFQGGDRISLIQCQNQLSIFSNPNCISYYYIGKLW